MDQFQQDLNLEVTLPDSRNEIGIDSVVSPRVTAQTSLLEVLCKFTTGWNFTYVFRNIYKELRITLWKYKS
jgi:hypothetical protein